MPVLTTHGGARGFGSFSYIPPKGLHWIIRGEGSGYGSKVLSKTGNVYVQTYPNTYKLSKNGELLWGSALGAGNMYALDCDSSENIYVAGSIVVKYNSSGSVQWQRSVSGSTSFTNLHTTSDGTSYAIGTITIGGTTYSHVCRINTDGTLAWSKYNTTTALSLASAYYNTTSGQVIVAGKISTSYVYIAALSPTDGSLQWQRQVQLLDGIAVYQGNCTVDSSGNIYVVAAFGDPRREILIKYNSSGTYQWSKSLQTSSGYPSNTLGYGSPGVDSSGNIYYQFYYDYGSGFTNNAGGFVKFNSSGTLLLSRQFSASNTAGWLRLSVSPDATVSIMGIYGVAKVNGDGSGTGSYSDFTYGSAAHVAVDPSVSASTAGYSFSNTGSTMSVQGYGSSAATLGSATLDYIGTEKG